MITINDRLGNALLSNKEIDLLRGAYLSVADLSDANLMGATGNMTHIKSLLMDTYPVVYTHDTLQIGCERHSIADWKAFADARIVDMDGKTALTFWRKWQCWIFQAIELSPAIATNTTED